MTIQFLPPPPATSDDPFYLATHCLWLSNTRMRHAPCPCTVFLTLINMVMSKHSNLVTSETAQNMSVDPIHFKRLSLHPAKIGIIKLDLLSCLCLWSAKKNRYMEIITLGNWYSNKLPYAHLHLNGTLWTSVHCTVGTSVWEHERCQGLRKLLKIFSGLCFVCMFRAF